MAPDPTMDPALQAKAEQKLETVQQVIRELETAMEQCGEQDRQHIRKIVNPSHPCFRTLILLITTPNYRGFVRLRCVVLRAVQIMLHLAQQIVGTTDSSVGSRCLLEFVGQDLAREALLEITRSAESREEPLLSCGALLVLAELGPSALTVELVPQFLDLFVTLPDRADDLACVALRVHAWGGAARESLLRSIVAHPGGKLLCEVLLQVVNRADPRRRLRAVKMLGGCLALTGSEGLLYTNDARVLVEILLRELPNQIGDAMAFASHAECFRALVARSPAAREHRRQEAEELLEDLREDLRHAPGVRDKCSEVLEALARAGA